MQVGIPTKCKLTIKYSPLLSKSKQTLTCITLLYFTVSPNSFLFSDSFCFCSSSAACYKLIIKYLVWKHRKQSTITDKEIRFILGTKNTTKTKIGGLLYSWCFGRRGAIIKYMIIMCDKNLSVSCCNVAQNILRCFYVGNFRKVLGTLVL